MIKESTLENFTGLQLGRAVGNTTRLVDQAIQIIFSGKMCLVEDHYKMGQDRRANRALFFLIHKRICNEFGPIRDRFVFNENMLTIHLREML